MNGSPRLLKAKEVAAKTSIPVSTIYRLMNDGRFPRSIPLGFQRVAWLEGEIDEWIAARVDEREEGRAAS